MIIEGRTIKTVEEMLEFCNAVGTTMPNTIAVMRKMRSAMSAIAPRGGPAYLNRIPASLGGASAGVKLPCGGAAG